MVEPKVKTEQDDVAAVKAYMDLEKAQKPVMTMGDALGELRKLRDLVTPQFGFSTPIASAISSRETYLRRMVANSVLKFDVAVASLSDIFGAEPLNEYNAKPEEL